MPAEVPLELWVIIAVIGTGVLFGRTVLGASIQRYSLKRLKEKQGHDVRREDDA